jgi:hypothetical protein
MSKEDLSNMDKMNTTMPFITKSAGLSRLNELGRFHASKLSVEEVEKLKTTLQI